MTVQSTGAQKHVSQLVQQYEDLNKPAQKPAPAHKSHVQEMVEQFENAQKPKALVLNGQASQQKPSAEFQDMVNLWEDKTQGC
jgi:fructose-1-phosphate kinase PfkB-like protein